MPIGPHRVAVMKHESAGTGGNPADASPFPTPIDINEDAGAFCGAYIFAPGELTPTCGVFRTAGELYLFDESNPAGVSLASVLAGGIDQLLTTDQDELVTDNSGNVLYAG